MTAIDDATLVAQAEADDQEAFGELVARHQGAMLAIAGSYFAADADARDAVQEAFVKAFECLDQLASDGRFAAWLARITVNTCVDTLRARTDKISLAQFATSVEVSHRLGRDQFTPGTLAGKHERSDLLKAAMGRLPEDQRAVLMLKFSDDMSYEQMAAYLDVPPTTVQGRPHRAKEGLRRMLKRLGSA
ncbi:MAG: sigma-70 family RNA polymerase sigma factor [Candidatus Brocadiae bacterium]|nr:sigma-70 family RNA polymerase sigma factor [Candidatus Brocadiia bacterium]